jgi:hypothetical protein
LPVYCHDIAGTHGNRTAGADNATTCDHPLAPSRCKEVRLVLNRQDGGSRWHQSHRGIPACDVDYCSERCGCHEAVVLCQVTPEGKDDLDLARGHVL